MLRLIAGRLAWGVLTLWVVSVLVFAGTELISGDAASAVLGQQASDPQLLAAVRENLGLDRPPVERYVHWLGGVLRGDLGDSLTIGSLPTGSGGTKAAGESGTVSVTELIGSRLVNSAILTGLAALVTIPLAILLGIVSAIRPGGIVDSIISSTTLGLIALPEFVTGTVFVLLFAIAWRLFPAVSLVIPGESLGMRAAALALPVATLAAASIAHTGRMIRGGMIEALESEYVQMARLKGMPERRVIFRHALRNALVPTVQVLALTIAWLAGGIVVVEVVFGYPGIGQALANAVSSRDLPTVQAISLVIASLYVVVNLLADLATIVLTPRLRQGL